MSPSDSKSAPDSQVNIALFSQFNMAEQSISQRGAKSCQLTAGGAKVIVQPMSEVVPVHFAPSTFDKDPMATRLTLEPRCNGETTRHFDAFDRWTKAYILQHSECLFKKTLTKEQIEKGYHPTVKRHETDAYPPLLRTKIDTSGRREITSPEDWRRVTEINNLEIVSPWCMSREMGWVIQCSALRVFEESCECPFAAGEVKEEAC